MKTHSLIITSAACLLISSLQSFATPRYTIKAIGAPPAGQSSTALSINKYGDVCGYYEASGSVCQAFVYVNGEMTAIDKPTNITSMKATGINDSRQVAMWGTYSPYGWRSYVWEQGSGLTQIGTTSSYVTTEEINNSGQVTGSFQKLDYTTNAYISDQNTWTYIPGTTTYPITTGFSINDKGQVAGYYYGPQGNVNSIPFFWDGTQRIDLPTYTSGYNIAWALNENGQIAGHCKLANGLNHAVLWQNGLVTDLDTLNPTRNSYAYGINNFGQVVGFGTGGGQLWENGNMLNLNSLVDSNSGWNIGVAYDINDAGMIVGAGTYNGQYQAFLMTPTVPEPSGLLTILLGLPALAGISRLRRK